MWDSQVDFLRRETATKKTTKPDIRKEERRWTSATYHNHTEPEMAKVAKNAIFHVKRQLTRLRGEKQKSTKENGTCVYDAIKQFDCET